MKTIFRAFCIALCIIFISGTALAVYDISQMSREQLLDLYKQVQDALFTKTIDDGVIVSPGKYLIGEEIPAGVYRIDCKGAYSSAIVLLYENESKSQKGILYAMTNEVLAELYGAPSIGKIQMEEGNVLVIQGGDVTISTYKGIAFD